MNLEEFANAVLAAVREKADGTFSVWLVTTIKNNGIKLTGISTGNSDNNVGPCIYLDDYYKEYGHGHMKIIEVADMVYQQIAEHRNDLKDIRTEDFLQWDVIKHYIFAKLINADMNKEFLEMMPHRMFLDLAVVYYVRVPGFAENEKIASILIQNHYMEMWGQNEENLYQIAVLNMRLDGKPLFANIGELLQGITPESVNPFEGKDIKIKMYVLTNQNKTFGAAEILDRNTLQEISEKFADDFIVLPSSIHETIIIPFDKAPEFSELAAMVYEVNTTQVVAEERLSYHIYRYDRNEGKLKIVA